jgi:hypothetical protein
LLPPGNFTDLSEKMSKREREREREKESEIERIPIWLLRRD